jgi:hypothetical protein
MRKGFDIRRHNKLKRQECTCLTGCTTAEGQCSETPGGRNNINIRGQKRIRSQGRRLEARAED